jgi:hypothetical protein
VYLYTVVTRSLKKWQSEDEIRAALWELTREVHALSADLNALLSAAHTSNMNGVVGSETAKTTQPIDEDRKIRPIARPSRRP